MGKKKHSSANKNGDSKSPSSSSGDISKSVFGDVAQEGQYASLFSDNNPYRRKPIDSSQPNQNQVGSSIDDGTVHTPDADEGKKRKRSKDKVSGIELASNDDGSESKGLSKKLKGKKGKLGKDGGEGFELSSNLKEKDVEEKSNAGMEVKGVVDLEKKKKKRKRDDLEAEYEAKRYGEVVAKNESGERESGGGVVGEKRKTMDSGVNLVDSKEGFDDEDKLLRTVFVGNLPLKVKKKALLKEFSQFGEVDSVRIRSVPIINSKTPRKGAIIKKQLNDSVDSVHAYIVFKMEESAKASLSHNMAVIGGNHIRVDRACPPRKKLKAEDVPLYDTKRTVFVGNLPFDVKDEEIYQLFSGLNNMDSSIEAIRVVRDPGTSMGKGIAYVLFKTREAANMIVKKRNLKIRERDLRLSHSKSNSTTSKGNKLSPLDQRNSSAKKFLGGSKTPDSKVKTMSYQGLRASKSGVQKKVHTKRADPLKLNPISLKVQKPKERTAKRPSVAARKAKALKGLSGSKQTGKKRKVESQTPDSSRKNKKARTFR